MFLVGCVDIVCLFTLVAACLVDCGSFAFAGWIGLGYLFVVLFDCCFSG